MIRLDAERREIVFTREGSPDHVRVRRFPLVSGHTCPTCGAVVRAAFETADLVDVHEYEEPPAANREAARYEVSFNKGVQIVAIGERSRMARLFNIHARSCCRFDAYTQPTLGACLAELLREVLGIWVWPKQVNVDRAHEAPGLRFAPDLLGAADPVVLFDRNGFIEAHSTNAGDGDPPRREEWRERLAEACGFVGRYVADGEEDCP